MAKRLQRAFTLLVKPHALQHLGHGKGFASCWIIKRDLDCKHSAHHMTCSCHWDTIPPGPLHWTPAVWAFLQANSLSPTFIPRAIFTAMVCDQCISLYLSADIVEKGNERHGVLPPSHRSVHPEDVKEQTQVSILEREIPLPLFIFKEKLGKYSVFSHITWVSNGCPIVWILHT